MRLIKTWIGVGLLIASATVALAATAGAEGVRAPARHDNIPGSRIDVEGTVVSINQDHRTFKLRKRHGGNVKIKVNKSTNYKRMSGFGALYEGMPIDVEAIRKNEDWIALTVKYEPD